MKDEKKNCFILQGTKLLVWELGNTGDINSATFTAGNDMSYGTIISGMQVGSIRWSMVSLLWSKMKRTTEIINVKYEQAITDTDIFYELVLTRWFVFGCDKKKSWMRRGACGC